MKVYKILFDSGDFVEGMLEEGEAEKLIYSWVETKYTHISYSDNDSTICINKNKITAIIIND